MPLNLMQRLSGRPAQTAAMEEAKSNRAGPTKSDGRASGGETRQAAPHWTFVSDPCASSGFMNRRRLRGPEMPDCLCQDAAVLSCSACASRHGLQPLWSGCVNQGSHPLPVMAGQFDAAGPL